MLRDRDYNASNAYSVETVLVEVLESHEQLERELQAERQRCEALISQRDAWQEVAVKKEKERMDAESRAASATALLRECREYIKRFNKAHDRNAILAAIDAALSAGGDDGK